MDEHENDVFEIAFSADSRWLATGSADNTARLWDLTSSDPSKDPIVFDGQESVSALAFDPQNRWFAMASWYEKTAYLWDLASTDRPHAPILLKGHKSSVLKVDFARHWLVTIDETTVRLWNLEADDPARLPIVLQDYKPPTNQVHVSDPWLAVRGERRVHVYDLRTNPTQDQVILEQERPLMAMAISRDGRWIATSDGEEASLWDLFSRNVSKSRIPLSGQNDVVELAFSPDSHWLATGGWEGEVCLWNLAFDEPSLIPVVFNGLNSDVHEIVFSADGQWLLAGSYRLQTSFGSHSPRKVRLWNLPLKALISRARQRVGRNFTQEEWREMFPGVEYRQTFPELPPDT